MRFGLSSSALSALILAAAVPPAFAQGVTPAVQFRVPAGPLQTALPLFAAQSGEQILYSTDLIAGRQSPGVTGSLRTDEALAALLQGTGLRGRRTRPNTLVVFDPASRAGAADDPVELDEVVVTGSLIRGAGPGPSPVVTVSRDDMDRAGHATVAEALAALPQNFGGAANEASAVTGADRTNQNSGYASGVNLRGLGADATLVLVNGRRLGGTGIAGDFADISTIPTSAIDRVEVLLDGASALYGSDAIGGVVNIILKQRFSGFETRARIGSTTDGAAGERQLAQTSGFDWSSGNAIVSYEYYERDALHSQDRRYAGDADLRSLGGTDRRQFYASPGNVMGLSGGTLAPLFGIPGNQDGTRLRPADFLAGQINLSNQREGTDVLPEQTRHSVFVAVNQDLGSILRLKADFRYGDRRFETQSGGAIGLFSITAANPFFVSPNGSASNQIAYSFINDLGPSLDDGRARSLGGSVGVEGDLSGWHVSGYVSAAQERLRSRAYNRVNTTSLAEALGAAPDSPLTPFSTARDGFFNPYGVGGSNTRAVLDFIGAGFQDVLGVSEVFSANLKIDGVLFDLPAGPLKLAAGLDYREERFDRGGVSFFSGTALTPSTARASERAVSAAFAELLIPIFSQANARPGLQRLDLSLAGRVEDFDDIGSTRNPKIGLIWSPASGVVLRISHGTSFRAPSLPELNAAYTLSPTILPRGPARIVTLMRYGGNPNLEPETARTTTVGGTWTPAGVDGLTLGVNAFKIDFQNRIGTPARDNTSLTLSDPALASFVTIIDPVNSAADRALLQGYLSDPRTSFSSLYPVEAYGAIVDARQVNAAVTSLEGVDFDVRYRRPWLAGELSIEAHASHLSNFERQYTATSPKEALVGQPNFPTAWRGRGDVSWTGGDLTFGLSANFVDGGFDAVRRASIGSWTTFDGILRWDINGTAGLSQDVSLTLVGENLLDEDPPFYDSARGLGYDAANANVLGRRFSIQMTKRW